MEKRSFTKAFAVAAAGAMAVSSMGMTAMAEETTYNVGICQLVQHTALDQATLDLRMPLRMHSGRR